jgi:hypothetical protein
MFVLQSILASAVPHATIDLLNKAGFPDRASAQETFFTRAKLLHDLDVEQGLLQRLQGSLILAITHVSHYMQRDHRYWFSNATCIAARMGLHRNIVSQSADISPKLLRRLWAVIYTWDVLLALNGMNTMRRFQNIDSKLIQLMEQDWEEDPHPEFHSLLQPVSSQEKLYLIMSCKLSLISRFDLHFHLVAVLTANKSASVGTRCSIARPTCLAEIWKLPSPRGVDHFHQVYRQPVSRNQTSLTRGILLWLLEGMSANVSCTAW